ncbi:MAG: PAS domain S-box protein [Pseudobdellovibrionaceae bacterium]
MKTAKDLMNPKTPILSFDSTVQDSIEYFQTNPNGFVAVMAGRDRLHGVLTEGNLVRIYLRYQSHPDKEALIFYRDCFEASQLILASEAFHEVVKKVMTSVGNRVFVIDAEGMVIGHITAKDILPHLSGQTQAKPMQGAAFDELKSQLYLYESFFSKSPFMMHSVNPQGFIQMANESLHNVLGYEYGQLIGKTIFDLYSKQSHEKAQAGIQTILSKGYHQVVKSQMVRKDGSLIEVELASRALQDPWKNSIGTITVSRPIDMSLLLEKF